MFGKKKDDTLNKPLEIPDDLDLKTSDADEFVAGDKNLSEDIKLGDPISNFEDMINNSEQQDISRILKSDTQIDIPKPSLAQPPFPPKGNPVNKLANETNNFSKENNNSMIFGKKNKEDTNLNITKSGPAQALSVSDQPQAGFMTAFKKYFFIIAIGISLTASLYSLQLTLAPQNKSTSNELQVLQQNMETRIVTLNDEIAMLKKNVEVLQGKITNLETPKTAEETANLNPESAQQQMKAPATTNAMRLQKNSQKTTRLQKTKIAPAKKTKMLNPYYKPIKK